MLAQKKGYSRYFIILQEDEKGYSLSNDKLSSGYVKLELKNEKCKVSYYVQNLKKGSSPYYMVLICNKKEVKRIIKIGEMDIDEQGRADVYFEYPYDNIADTLIPMDKVSGAAVIKILDGNIISVMSGFSSTEIPDWKTYGIEADVREDVVEEEKNVFEEYEEKIGNSEFFRCFSDKFERFDNISDEIKRCIWYKIPWNNVDQSELYYPVMNLYNEIKERGYLLVGGKYDREGNLKYVAYGIPGKNEGDSQPLRGESGFVTWVSEKSGTLGYWLMFYDYKASTIIVPLK